MVYKDRIRRRKVYEVDFGEVNEKDGSIQKGIRPALLVQNNLGNKFSKTFSFVPFTRQLKKLEQITHVKTEYFGVALCEQVVTVNIDKIKNYMGMLSEEEMEKVNNALAIHLGLKPLPKNNKTKRRQ